MITIRIISIAVCDENTNPGFNEHRSKNLHSPPPFQAGSVDDTRLSKIPLPIFNGDIYG